MNFNDCIMENKQYFTNRRIYKLNLWPTIVCGVVGGFSIILLLSPTLLYNVYDILFPDIDNIYLFLSIVIAVSLWFVIPGIIYLRNANKKPYVVLGDDCVTITNVNNGDISVVYYKDIERIELSETKLLGKKVRCINIYPVKGAFEKLSLRAQKSNRQRMERIYRKEGAIEQVYGYALDIPIEAAFDDFQEVLKEYKESK